MTIWIVWFTNFDGIDEFHSAHSSPELAQERINRYSIRDRSSFRVDSYELDGE
ncbi:hypothetical protein [Pseudomonas sp. JUb52]|uniref:hypothetical protein n=1 Tax=Pseudomonas sp. JUb52 TaxID=2485127 RepID=UPI0010E24618|nr:hypothetical protein [Pseudomonas sp. JUb52]TCQ83898.1 hypothetical protein EC839_1148 [Pseudomonas sp. JUb52]